LKKHDFGFLILKHIFGQFSSGFVFFKIQALIKENYKNIKSIKSWISCLKFEKNQNLGKLQQQK